MGNKSISFAVHFAKQNGKAKWQKLPSTTINIQFIVVNHISLNFCFLLRFSQNAFWLLVRYTDQCIFDQVFILFIRTYTPKIKEGLFDLK